MSTEAMEAFLSQVHETSRFVCPDCGPERKKKGEKTLSVTVEGGDKLYHCHHCGSQGRISSKPFIVMPTSQIRAISVPKTSDDQLITDYLQSRGIDYAKVRDRYTVVTGTRFFRARGEDESGEVPAIGFVYGDREAVKWRSIKGKRFTQDGAARSLWGVEAARRGDAKTLIITEGEMDALAAASVLPPEAYVVSVPNGAPQAVSNRRVEAEEDTKFSYVWDAKDVIKSAEKIILATDRDEAGEALAEELGRRIGRARCYVVQFPGKSKDLNEVLVDHGAEALRKCIDEAQPMPLEGVYSVDDYRAEIQHLYRNGVVGGLSTGIPAVDKLFTIVPGQLSVITGIPGSGKSEFVDQLMVNLAKLHKWKFAVASFENPPPLHIAKLAEKIVGKPFFDGPTPRMSAEESEEALAYIKQHWMFLEQRSGEHSTIESILDRAQQAIMRMGCRGVVIDPYNYIGQSQKVEHEHQFINEMLTKLVAFARANSIHIFFVAHPAKMPTDQNGRTAVPKGMNISGSAAFFAKADIGITVHLNQAREVEVHCWKVRFKWIGTVGSTKLQYDIPSGRYSEPVYDMRMPAPIRSWQDTDDDEPF